jgi:hypothetical protein
MHAAPPFAFIHDFRQQQNRPDRIEKPAHIKRAQGGALAAGEEIGDALICTALGYQPRSKIVAAAAELADLDLWIRPLESLDRLLGQRSVLEDIDADQSFLLSGRNGSVPFCAPVRLASRSKSRALKTEQQKQQREYFFCHFGLTFGAGYSRSRAGECQYDLHPISASTQEGADNSTEHRWLESPIARQLISKVDFAPLLFQTDRVR